MPVVFCPGGAAHIPRAAPAPHATTLLLLASSTTGWAAPAHPLQVGRPRVFWKNPRRPRPFLPVSDLDCRTSPLVSRSPRTHNPCARHTSCPISKRLCPTSHALYCTVRKCEVDGATCTCIDAADCGMRRSAADAWLRLRSPPLEGSRGSRDLVLAKPALMCVRYHIMNV